MKRISYILILCCVWISTNAAIRIGTRDFDPPYVQRYDPAIGLKGFDIEYMKKICTRLNWDCQFVPMKDNQLLSALTANKIDFAIGSIVITPDVQENFLFSAPYLNTEIGFVLKKNSTINKVSELEGKTIGAIHGRAYPKNTILSHETYTEIMDFQ